MKIVEVEWFDAQSSTQSFTIEELRKVLKPMYSKSVGYLVEDNKEYIVLGFTDFGEGLIKHHQCIPRGMIKKIRILESDKK